MDGPASQPLIAFPIVSGCSWAFDVKGVSVVLRDSKFCPLYLSVRGWVGAVKACVIVAHSFATARCNDPFFLPLCPLDHRKNISTCCEAVMMDRRPFPTHFNELKLGGVLVPAIGELVLAAAVDGAALQVGRLFIGQDIRTKLRWSLCLSVSYTATALPHVR
jgi:hypothetical protein